MGDDDRRVQFDFEVDFTNGGGIQGQGFRLDIDGEQISDQELAAYVVRDLRLLMVGETRILDKQVVSERHKRRTRAPAAAADADAATGAGPGAGAGAGAATGDHVFIDLSHTIEDGMVTYRGLPAPVVCDFLSREASRDHYAPGTEFQIGQIEMCANTGTYVDSPYHRHRDGADLAQLPLASLAELPAVLIDVTGSAALGIDAAQILPFQTRGRAVLIHTGWDRHWRTDAYFENHPFLTADAAAHLVAQGAALVGIDSLNIDDTADGARPVHTALLGAGIPICEHLTGLQGLPGESFRFTAVPVKVHRMGTFPVRAYATISG